MKINRALAIAAIAILPLVSGATFAGSNVPAQFKDECHCVGCHAEYRWDVKTDDEAAPQSVSNSISPSDIGAWHGPGGIFKKDTARKGKERRWYALTGRVTLVKQEVDGDLHIQLVDEAAQDDDVNVVVEVPFGEPWCDIRKEVFSWTNQKFPFKTAGKKFTLQKHPVISVTGKAFYDAIHGGGDTSSNRRPVPKNAAPTTKDVAIWEIHPVMNLEVISE
jgi:hypothetical protein